MGGILILAMAYVISHFYRAFLAVLSPVLSAELALDPADLSSALGAWFAAFALSQFLVGSLLDRIGPRRTAAWLFAVFGGGGALLFSQASDYWTVITAMIALGIGCSPILMASVYIFKRSFKPKQFAMLTSANIAVGMAGNIMGTQPLAWAMDVWGWRTVLLLLAGATLLISALIVWLVEDPKPVEAGKSGSYWDVLRLRTLWWILPLIFFNYALAGGMRGLWAGPYFDLVHGLDAHAIGQATLFMALAMVFGSFAYGPLDQIFNTRKWVVVAGSSIVLVAITYWAFNPNLTPSQATVALMLIGLFAMTFGITMAHASANIPDHLAGRGVTLINFFNMGGVGVMQWVTAYVYRTNADAQDAAIGMQAVFICYAALFSVALAIYLFSTDAKPQPSS